MTTKPDVAEYLRHGYNMRFNIVADSHETYFQIFVDGQLASHQRYFAVTDPEVYAQMIEQLTAILLIIREEKAKRHEQQHPD